MSRETVNRQLRNARREELECLVDDYNLQGVLDLLVEICAEKADHLRSTWQDESGAAVWDRYSVILNSVNLYENHS